MTSEITRVLQHSLASPMVVIDSALAKSVDKCILTASCFDTIGELNIDHANEAIRDIAILAKEIEENRVQIKKPVDELVRRIQQAAKSVSVPLDRAKRELEGKIGAHLEAVEWERERIETANAKRIEEARQEQERKRQEEEAAALERQVEKNKKQRRFGLGTLLGIKEPEADPEPEPVPATPAPAIAVPLEKVPERVQSPVQIRKREVLQITDRTLIPLEVAGVQLMKPDEAAITRLLKARVPVPGCKLVDKTSHATRTG